MTGIMHAPRIYRQRYFWNIRNKNSIPDPETFRIAGPEADASAWPIAAFLNS